VLYSLTKINVLYIYGRKYFTIQNIFMVHYLYFIADFCKRKINNFHPYNVLLAIATNIPVQLLCHIYAKWPRLSLKSAKTPGTFITKWCQIILQNYTTDIIFNLYIQNIIFIKFN